MPAHGQRNCYVTFVGGPLDGDREFRTSFWPTVGTGLVVHVRQRVLRPPTPQEDGDEICDRHLYLVTRAPVNRWPAQDGRETGAVATWVRRDGECVRPIIRPESCMARIPPRSPRPA